LLETLLREYLRVLVAGSGDDSVSQAMYVDYVTGKCNLKLSYYLVWTPGLV
jgi:hypothetical protein